MVFSLISNLIRCVDAFIGPIDKPCATQKFSVSMWNMAYAEEGYGAVSPEAQEEATTFMHVLSEPEADAHVTEAQRHEILNSVGKGKVLGWSQAGSNDHVLRDW
jgi:hypothetical protein